jgi:hypothetical protein
LLKSWGAAVEAGNRYLDWRGFASVLTTLRMEGASTPMIHWWREVMTMTNDSFSPLELRVIEAVQRDAPVRVACDVAVGEDWLVWARSLDPDGDLDVAMTRTVAVMIATALAEGAEERGFLEAMLAGIGTHAGRCELVHHFAEDMLRLGVDSFKEIGVGVMRLDAPEDDGLTLGSRHPD